MAKRINNIRHYFIKPKISEFIVKNNIKSLPVDPMKLIQNNGWTIRTYQFYARKHGISIKDIIDTFGSEDAFTVYEDGHYSITYNDKIISPGRIRFTLMHEIGHIYLNHLPDFDQTVLARGGLADTEYELLEKEANIFSSEVLSPYPVLKILGWNQYNTIQKHCGLSKRAAISRAEQMLDTVFTKEMARKSALIIRSFHTFIHKKKCVHCGYGLISEKEKYCPICGSILTWGDGKQLIYKSYKLNEVGKAIICPKCENEETHTDGNYCKVCGTYITNCCSEETDLDLNGNEYIIQKSCGAIAEGNARFCVYCGNPTTYYKNRLLLSWDEEKAEMEPKAYPIRKHNHSRQ